MHPADSPVRRWYRSSGRVRWDKFLPWCGLTFVVSAILACALQVAFEEGFYYFVLTPLLAALPVAGMTYVSVEYGHCRSRFVACLLSVVASVVLFVGYYYADMVVRSGEARLQMLPDFIAFRMQTDIVGRQKAKKELRPRTNQGGGKWFSAAIDFGLIVSVVGSGAFARARRAYCETCQNWKTRELAILPAEKGEGVVRRLANGTLIHVAEIPADTIRMKWPYTVLAIEYCPQAEDCVYRCPVYFSVRDIRRGSSMCQFDGTLGTTLLQQCELDSAEVAALIPKFPSLALLADKPAAPLEDEWQMDRM